MRKLKIGLIINPYAGIGGSVALKGSDGTEIRDKALALGAVPQANQRATVALKQIETWHQSVVFYTASNEMGQSTLNALGYEHQVVYHSKTPITEADDTEQAVQAILNQQVDLLVFAGGDGTARNIYNQVQEATLVLGIPAGCKIHSGVYAITPKAAGLLMADLIQGQALTLGEADVMDIDEQLFRQGQVKAKRYGDMRIPMDLRYMQAVKMGGKESDELVLADIAADVIDKMNDEPDTLFLIGSGSTTQSVLNEMGITGTLLGVDAVYQESLINADLTSHDIESLFTQYTSVKLIMTLIGGQGHLFGRGNQQLSPSIIKYISRENIIVVATKSKISKLNGKPLICDTGDEILNQQLAGPINIVTGYHDYVIYPVANQITNKEI
ncbi:ATP-NAD kinase family protein [Algibacillus agarilyticus]|uniref:ATP-NAD kinase family protein n=1 Tax=Algibacillus agarilyticus TaxID=2234133 RepID=UPI000DD016FB|nr:ATP-NAD kinase family protein [Algibacillus agarilyticus]